MGGVVKRSSSALQNPRYKFVFGPRNQMVGTAVETEDGHWRATKGPASNLSIFGTFEECASFLISRASEQGDDDET
jgi:hypothetical protein